MQRYLLKTGEITVEHTAINLASYLEEALEKWSLQSTQVSAIVTLTMLLILLQPLADWNGYILGVSAIHYSWVYRRLYLHQTCPELLVE